jgi:hypothetical protein
LKLIPGQSDKEIDMTNDEYLWPGIIAIVVVALSPIYWGYIALSDYIDGIGLGLVIADGVFFVLYALMIYVYSSFRRILHDQNNYRGIDVLLTLMIGTCAIFAVGSIALEIFAPVIDDQFGATRHESILIISTLFTVSCTVVFGVLDILIAAVLLRNSQQLPDLMKSFAIVTLIQGVFEVTIIFSFFSILIYPIATLILAMYFLRKPEMVEVV